jgi:hypothetical protein
MKYIDATWDPEAPADTRSHIVAVFLRWALDSNLVSSFHTTENADRLGELRDGAESAIRYVVDVCDERLIDEDLNETGQAFAQAYCGEGRYLGDYLDAFGAPPDVNSDAREAKLRALLDQRLARWGENRQCFKRPWWKRLL